MYMGSYHRNMQVRCVAVGVTSVFPGPSNDRMDDT